VDVEVLDGEGIIVENEGAVVIEEDSRLALEITPPGLVEVTVALGVVSGVADVNVLVVDPTAASDVVVLQVTVGIELVEVQSPVPQLPQEVPSPQLGPPQPGPPFVDQVDHVDHVESVDHEDQVCTNSVQLLAAFSQLVGT